MLKILLGKELFVGARKRSHLNQVNRDHVTSHCRVLDNCWNTWLLLGSVIFNIPAGLRGFVLQIADRGRSFVVCYAVSPGKQLPSWHGLTSIQSYIFLCRFVSPSGFTVVCWRHSREKWATYINVKWRQSTWGHHETYMTVGLSIMFHWLNLRLVRKWKSWKEDGGLKSLENFYNVTLRDSALQCLNSKTECDSSCVTRHPLFLMGLSRNVPDSFLLGSTILIFASYMYIYIYIYTPKKTEFLQKASDRNN